ncbi:MAG: right-handed parallel beta-helix repeat-containing protein [Planctomycetes bacterium]|nr:right-handed parallel beta-helix repeat-containing protein [Planctomycetota bacterium]
MSRFVPILVLLLTIPWRVVVAQETPESEPVQVTGDLTLEPGQVLRRGLVVRGHGLVIDGRGATIQGPGEAGRPGTFLGVGIRIEGGSAITIRNLRVEGFALGLSAEATEALLVEDCDLGGNQDDPEAGWNDERVAGGLRLEALRGATLRRVRARRCWNGLDLHDCRECLIEDCDFSHCSNNGARLRLSSENLLRHNDLSHGIRLRPGEAHARDSCCLMIESGSDRNLVVGNDLSHGGDGLFVRISSGWISTGNRFVDNDCSHAHNHGVECWSPGNTFLRNRANHCSYGFWMGGSDGTVMIGNEAGWNGREDGPHNAPEAGIGHGGIVFVRGAAQHLRLEDNHCHDNAGPGIVVRGHRVADAVDWPFFDLLIQGNRLERNRWGLWLERGAFAVLRGNRELENLEDDRMAEVVDVDDDRGTVAPGRRPRARLEGPSRATVGQKVVFDAARSLGFSGTGLRHRWRVDDRLVESTQVEVAFERPGRHRVALQVTDAVGADTDHVDVLVGSGGAEIGTEGTARHWSFVMGLDPDHRGEVRFVDDPDAVEGRYALEMRVERYMGRDVAAVVAFPERPLDVSKRRCLSFWIRYRNPNFWGFQGPNPVLRLLTRDGYFTYVPQGPKGPRNILWELPDPEGREGWTRFSIPLAGGGGFERSRDGKIELDFIQSISFQFDSWGGDPFTVWIDGLCFE